MKSHKKDVACKECNKNFSFDTGLSRHNIMKHRTYNKVICELCKKSYSRRDILNNHIKRIHEGIKESRVKCHICEKDYSRRDILKRHIKTMHKELENGFKWPTEEELAALKSGNNNLMLEKSEIINNEVDGTLPQENGWDLDGDLEGMEKEISEVDGKIAEVTGHLKEVFDSQRKLFKLLNIQYG